MDMAVEQGVLDVGPAGDVDHLRGAHGALMRLHLALARLEGSPEFRPELEGRVEELRAELNTAQLHVETLVNEGVKYVRVRRR